MNNNSREIDKWFQILGAKINKKPNLESTVTPTQDLRKSRQHNKVEFQEQSSIIAHHSNPHMPTTSIIANPQMPPTSIIAHHSNPQIPPTSIEPRRRNFRPQIKPIQPSVEPIKPPVEPIKPPIEPIKPHVEPIKPPVEPIKPHVEPIKPPVEPIKPPVEPIKPTIEPIQPTIEPIQPYVEPIKPYVEPIQPHVEPIQPTIEPIQPSVEPIQPSVEPIQPHVEPIQPPVEPIQPAVELDVEQVQPDVEPSALMQLSVKMSSPQANLIQPEIEHVHTLISSSEETHVPVALVPSRGDLLDPVVDLTQIEKLKIDPVVSLISSEKHDQAPVRSKHIQAYRALIQSRIKLSDAKIEHVELQQQCVSLPETNLGLIRNEDLSVEKDDRPVQLKDPYIALVQHEDVCVLQKLISVDKAYPPPQSTKSHFQTQLDSQISSKFKQALQAYKLNGSTPISETTSVLNLKGTVKSPIILHKQGSARHRDRQSTCHKKISDKNLKKEESKSKIQGRSRTRNPSKAESRSKSKSKSKIKSKDESRSRSKSKSKSKSKIKAESRSKSKIKAESRSKSKSKIKAESRSKSKSKIKAESRTRSRSRSLNNSLKDQIKVMTKKKSHKKGGKFMIDQPLRLTDQIDDQMIYLGQPVMNLPEVKLLRKGKIDKFMKIKVWFGTLKKIAEEMDLLLTLSLGQINNQKMTYLTHQSLKVITDILGVANQKDIVGLAGLIDIYGRLEQGLKIGTETLKFEIGYYLTQLSDSINRIMVNLTLMTKSNLLIK